MTRPPPGRRLARLLPLGYLLAVPGIAGGDAGLVALSTLAERNSRFVAGGHRFVERQR